MARYALSVLFVLAAALVASTARAQGFPAEPARLEYKRLPGAASCPDEEAFREEVAIVRHTDEMDFLHADASPADPYDDETVTVRVILERAGGKFRGTVVHMPPAGSDAKPPEVRVNSECEDLVRDLADLASYFLPLIVKRCPECPACPAPAPPPAPPPAPAEPSPVKPNGCDPGLEGDPDNDEACKRLLAKLEVRYKPAVNPSFWLSAGPLLTIAYTSNVGPGFQLDGSIQGKHWSVAIEAQVTLPAPVRVAPGKDFDMSSFMGFLVPCARLGETVTFFGCGVVGAGYQYSYDSQGENPSGVGSLVGAGGPLIRVGPRAGLELPFGGRFAAWAYGEVSFFPIFYDRGYVDPGQGVKLWTQNVASGFIGAGISVRLTD